MSVEPPKDGGKGYCDPEDVATYFDKYDDFTQQTDPDRQMVLNLILAKSNLIDQETGHAWRERRMENEMKDLRGTYYFSSGTPISLMKRDIRTPLDPEKGDKLEIWRGQEYEEWVSDPNKEEDRNGDFWIDESQGTLYIYRRRWFWTRHKEIKVTYRYGKDRVPAQIRNICARLVAAELFRSQMYRVTTPGNEESPDPVNVAETWEEQAMKNLERYKEVRSIGV